MSTEEDTTFVLADKTWDPRVLAAEGCPLKSTDDNVLIRQEPAATEVGGIHLPGKVAIKARPRRGVIVAVGEGVYVHSSDKGGVPNRVPLDSSVGDVVYFAEFAGFAFTHDEVEYISLKERDVFAKVKAEPTEQQADFDLEC